MSTRERFIITLEAGRCPLNRTPSQRLRLLLKIAGRCLALRCITITSPNTTTDPESEASP